MAPVFLFSLPRKTFSKVGMLCPTIVSLRAICCTGCGLSVSNKLNMRDAKKLCKHSTGEYKSYPHLLIVCSYGLFSVANVVLVPLRHIASHIAPSEYPCIFSERERVDDKERGWRVNFLSGDRTMSVTCQSKVPNAKPLLVWCVQFHCVNVISGVINSVSAVYPWCLQCSPPGSLPNLWTRLRLF